MIISCITGRIILADNKRTKLDGEEKEKKPADRKKTSSDAKEKETRLPNTKNSADVKE